MKKLLLDIGYCATFGIVAIPKNESDNKLLQDAYTIKGEVKWQKNTK